MAKSKAMNKSADMRKSKRKGPKKPLSPYLIYSMARRDPILKEKPELRSNVTEMSKIIGAEWRQMSEEAKKPYQLQHEQEKKRYLREKEEFDQKSGSKGSEEDNVMKKAPPVKRQKRAPKEEPSEEEEEEEEEEEAEQSAKESAEEEGEAAPEPNVEEESDTSKQEEDSASETKSAGEDEDA